MSILINAISAIGNNNSFYPLLVRDCGIEAPTKVCQTYNQNAKESKIMAKHATRERIIDEYGSSFFWLGGIPFTEWACNKIIKMKGFCSKINYKLLDKNKKAMSDIDRKQQGIDINIEKFSKEGFADDVKAAVEDLKKAKINNKTLRNLTAFKYTAAIALPVAMMGYVLPKSNFALTNYLIAKDAKKGLIPEKYLVAKGIKSGNSENITTTSKSEKSAEIEYNRLYMNSSQFSALNTFKKNDKQNFTGFSSFMTGLTQQQKMAITDGGLGAGRIGTSRRKNEAYENTLRVVGMMYLNFVAPKQIDKVLDKGILSTFGINPSLDPKILANKKFLAKVKYNELELPKSQEEVIEFIDNNPKSMFAQIAKQEGEVKFLESGTRDPRCYVNTEKVYKLAQKIDTFAKSARESGNVAKYAKKALGAKSASILTNIAISSALLAVGLPQAQFLLRRFISGSKVDPGLM